MSDVSAIERAEAYAFMRELWRPSDWIIRPGMAPEYRGPASDGQHETTEVME